MRRVLTKYIASWIALFVILDFGKACALVIEKQTIQTSAPIPTWIVFPEKADGKVPAMILLHGSTGVHKEREWVYAEKFAKMGMATVIIDTFAPRKIKSTAGNQNAVSAAEMSKDVIQILQVVAKNPKIDTSKIGLMGFSKGGTATMRSALAFLNKKDDAEFALFIAMYPSCPDYRLKPRTTGKPIKVILGGNDHWTNPQSCIEVSDALRDNGADITTVTIPDAEHGWDVPGRSHYTDPNAENFSRCHFVEVRPQIWEEKSSKIVIFDERGRTKDYEKALSKCVTRGTSAGYSAAATAKSWSLIESYVAALK